MNQLSSACLTELTLFERSHERFGNDRRKKQTQLFRFCLFGRSAMIVIRAVVPIGKM